MPAEVSQQPSSWTMQVASLVAGGWSTDRIATAVGKPLAVVEAFLSSKEGQQATNDAVQDAANSKGPKQVITSLLRSAAPLAVLHLTRLMSQPSMVGLTACKTLLDRSLGVADRNGISLDTETTQGRVDAVNRLVEFFRADPTLLQDVVRKLNGSGNGTAMESDSGGIVPFHRPTVAGTPPESGKSTKAS